MIMEENATLTEVEQKDLFGEPVIPPGTKQIPHRNSNIRRERFVREYVLNGRNATKAAIEAGYSKDEATARSYASWLLTQPDVKECLSYFTADVKAKALIRADELVEEIRETLQKMDGHQYLRSREPLLSLLARMGGHLEDSKVEVNNVLSIKDILPLEKVITERGNNS